MNPTRRILAIVPDLFFAEKIRTTARHLGIDIVASDASRLLEDCRAAAPDLVVVDLQAAPGALDGIRALKADPTLAAIPVTGFYSHVDDALRRAALEAGIDQALPRSAFTARLAAILAG